MGKYALLCPSTDKIHTSIRSPNDFDTLNLLSASNRTVLITFWSASWCPSCKIVAPIVREMIESGAGENQGGVGFAEVEFDSPTLGEVAGRYMVCDYLTMPATASEKET